MKRSEYYYTENVKCNPFDDFSEFQKDVLKAIKQAQIDAYNEALDDAIENASIDFIDLPSGNVFDYTDVLCDNEVDVIINEQSILKLKK